VQKIIIDTNVLVSALISDGNPFKIIHNLVLADRVKTYVSDEILQEYNQVLSRDKFSGIPDFKKNVSIIIRVLSDLSIHQNPDRKIELLQDEDDNKVLELAVHCEADFIITGNTRDFTISKIGQTKIVSPTIYWENYQP
jgi:putative PIN family toxin of toxin-antitoxin system